MTRYLKFLVRLAREQFSGLVAKLSRSCNNDLLSLKGSKKGQVIVLLGGGPSLNKMNLALLREVDTMACNAFYLKLPELDWTPSYYTVEDPLPASDNSKEIEELDDTIKIIPKDLRKVISRGKGKTLYVNFFRSVGRFSKDWPCFWKRSSSHFFWGGTVMYFNIQLAAFLGYSKIYLIGVDLNYVIPDDIKKNGKVLTSVSDDVNHFNSNYFGKGKKWHLPETERMQTAFTKALVSCRRLGIDLVNLGVESKLQNVPKDSFDRIFGHHNTK